MLAINNIKKTFNAGSVTEKLALNSANLTLQSGDFVTIIGGNGAGKSTLLNAIAGVFPIDEGKIQLKDVDLTKLPEHRRAAYIGRVFQDPMLGTASNMTIEENLSMALRRGKRRGLSWGISKKELALFIEQLELLDLGLENRLKSKVGLLSGGQRQAITLLMATIKRPNILLLDEHTAALDPKTAEKVLQLTRHIVESNSLTTLMVTHNMRDALQYGNRTIMMHEGKVILDIDSAKKQRTTVEDLLRMFETASGEEMMNDRMLLTK